MSVKSILKEQIELSKPSPDIIYELKEKSSKFISLLKKELSKRELRAEVFVGGSFAKGTLVRKEKYDVDILVRFDKKFDNLSDLLESPIKGACKSLGLKFERIHGSRDYFRTYLSSNKYFEVIPVTKIAKPSEERNVTDLTYFHVPYIKKRIKNKENQVRLAKVFMQSNKVYGAETYVGGFSGYAVECLIIYYKSFEKMLRELAKLKIGERLVIDIEKKYKKKNDVFFELNESKLHSPIILIDPTYKERNALAALTNGTFEKFQKAAKDFLKNPSKKFFEEKITDVESLKKESAKKKAEFVHIKLETNKQAGDIAGTKLKKFHFILEDEIKKYFELLKHEFEYDGKHGADVYLIVKSRKEIVRIGPPMHLKKHVERFKSEHLDTFEKNKFIHARIKVNFNAKSYLDAWQKGNKKLMSEMDVTGIKII